MLVNMNGLGDLMRLLIHSYNNCGRLMVHADFKVVVTDFFDGLPGNVLYVQAGIGVDFSKNHTEGVFDGCFTCNF